MKFYVCWLLRYSTEFAPRLTIYHQLTSKITTFYIGHKEYCGMKITIELLVSFGFCMNVNELISLDCTLSPLSKSSKRGFHWVKSPFCKFLHRWFHPYLISILDWDRMPFVLVFIFFHFVAIFCKIPRSWYKFLKNWLNYKIYRCCLANMSVERSSGLNVKTVLSGANFLPMLFFPQDGPVLRTRGIQKGKMDIHFFLIPDSVNILLFRLISLSGLLTYV